MNESDIDSVALIYNQGIDTKISTFDDFYVSPEKYRKYISNKKALGSAIIIAEYENIVIGWSSIEPKSNRNAYRFTSLGSTYMRENYRYKEVGKKLILKKFEKAKELGYKSMIGEILSVNEASLNVCYSLGYKKVGEIKNAGFRNDSWIGLTIIQKFL